MTADSQYRFPAEWERHETTWLTWPHNLETWPQNLREAQAEFEYFARTLAEVENVRILATDDLARELQNRFQNVPAIEIVDIPTNDCWIRDYGPTFVQDRASGTVAGIDWSYDGWGEKYPPFDDDQKAACRILKSISLPRIRSELILEGGAIDANGGFTCLTTPCIFERNRSLTPSRILSELMEKTGVNQVIVLDGQSIEGDDTDGHIDQVARFVERKRAVVSRQQMGRVQHKLNQAGITTVELPDPNPVTLFGKALPCRYTNFYIANGVLIVPKFEDSNDERAAKILEDQFPDRRVIQLASRNLAVGLGSFHCLSQQQLSPLQEKAG